MAGHSEACSNMRGLSYFIVACNMEVDGEDVENEQALEELFRKLDRDSSGTIDMREVQEALRALGYACILALEFIGGQWSVIDQ